MADRLYRAALPMLQRDIAQAPFRLIGVGLSSLVSTSDSDATDDFLDPAAARRISAERAADQIRARFGHESILLGRSVR
jgi:DNA polymerase-4